MSNLIPIAIACFIEGFITYYYFSTNYNSKFKSYISILMIEGLYGLHFIPNVVLKDNNIFVNTFTFFLMTLLFAKLCFDISFKSCIFHSAILIFIMVATEIVTEVGTEYFVGRIMFVMNSDVVYFFVGVAISKALYFVIVYFVANTLSYKKNHAVGSMSITYLNLLYPMIVLILLVFLFRISLEYQLSKELLVVTMVVTSASIVLCCLTAIYTQRIQKRENEFAELKAREQKNEMDMQYLNLLEQKNQAMQILTHDYKNHLFALRNMGGAEQQEYIDRITNEMNANRNTCHSGNHTLDIIINKYVTECELKGVTFDFEIKISNLGFVSDYDLVTILGNLLDNALEAAQQSEAKIISFKTNKINTYDSVMITNSCDTPPDKNLITTKQNKKLHGVGLKSVTKTLKQYGGELEWEYNSDKREFVATVILLNKEA